jgi:hypothetical protein
VVVYLVHTPVGANATRIAVLVAAPVIVAAARMSRRVLIVGAVGLAALLPLAQFHNDLLASRNTDTSRAFVAPLLKKLSGDPLVRNHRVEVIDTATHWPSTYLLPKLVLARGWERQIDEAQNPLFYGRAPLTAKTYRAFLNHNAVGAIAVPTGVPLDYGVTGEAALVRAGLPYLKEVWRDRDWRLYNVERPRPIIAAPARVMRLTDTGLTIWVPKPGRYLLRMQWSPDLAIDGGQIRQTPGDRVELVLATSGTHSLHAVWRF